MKELIRKAVIVHFACDKNNLKCDPKLEDSPNAALDFFNYFETGIGNDGFKKLNQTARYRNKLKLIMRYLNNNEND